MFWVFDMVELTSALLSNFTGKRCLTHIGKEGEARASLEALVASVAACGELVAPRGRVLWVSVGWGQAGEERWNEGGPCLEEARERE